MNKPAESQSDWSECQPGDLVGYGLRAQSALRRRALQVTALTVAICAVAVGTAWNQWSRGADENQLISGVTCKEVEAELAQYARHQLSEDRELHFREHIDRCPTCQEKLAELRAVPVSFRASETDHAAACPHCRMLSFAAHRTEH